MHNFEIPTKEELDRAALVIAAVTGGFLIVKLLDHLIDCIREHRQNKKIKKLDKKVEELEERIEKLESEK